MALRLKQLDHFNGYKTVVSIIMGLLGFAGCFIPVSLSYDGMTILVIWSLIFPLMAVKAWGGRYGLFGIIPVFVLFFPGYVQRYGVLACFVIGCSYVLWIAIHSYGAVGKRPGSLFRDSFFLQTVYSLFFLLLYLCVSPLMRIGVEDHEISVRIGLPFVEGFLMVLVCERVLRMPYIGKWFDPSSGSEDNSSPIADKAENNSQSKEWKEKKNYRLLIEEMLNGFYIVEPVFNERQEFADIRFVDVNRAFERHATRKIHEVLGKTWTEVYGVPNRYLTYYEQVYRTGVSHIRESYHPSIQHKRYLANIFKMNEHHIGVIYENITDQIKAEGEIKTLAANLNAIFESTKEMIWLADENHQLIMYNQAFQEGAKRLLGIDVKPGLVPNDFFMVDKAQVFANCYDRSIKEGQFVIEEDLDGTIVEASFNPIFIDGCAAGVAVFCKDITEQKRAEQEIMRLNSELEQRVIERTNELEAVIRELEAFTYTVSHDLKSPLRAIDAYSRIMLEDYPEQLEGDLKEMTGRIKNISRETIVLINKLLKYSTSIMNEVNREEIDMQELVTAVFREQVVAFPERQIQLVLETELPQVKADGSLMRQVVDNLISNAVKFTKNREHAVITVGHVSRFEDVEIYVRDNGIGFDIADSNELFVLFQRLHTVDEFEGTGIGLPTVSKIIRRHGGRTHIIGKPDEGATVYFTLPF